MIDVEIGFYVVRISNKEGYKTSLFGDPWLSSEQHLIVQRWYPSFYPKVDFIMKLIIRVKVPKLPLQFFNKNFLARVGIKLGKTLWVNETTLIASQGQYVLISVEIDLEKPLIAKFKFCRRVRRVEYEGLHAVCFHCRRYAYKLRDCLNIPKPNPFTYHTRMMST